MLVYLGKASGDSKGSCPPIACTGVIMNIKLNRVNLRLEKNQVLPIREAHQVKVICQKGTLWITQDYDQRDIILEQGQSFTMNRKSPALVSAMVSSVLVLEEPAPFRQRGLLSHMLSLLGRWNEPIHQTVRKSYRHPAIELRGY
jgi:hypothetical protein